MRRYAIVVVMGLACGGGSPANAPAGTASNGVRDTTLAHEPCAGDGPREDANGDGKADIQRITKNGREVCRIADLDFDGKPELFSYFNESGQLQRRETDLDGNGIPNMVDHFTNGTLTVRELDTASMGKVDTWEIFDAATGKRIRRERDQNGDGRIDQWWTWQGEQITISADKNEDGQPDPESALVWTTQGLVPAIPATGAPGAPVAAPTTSAPSAAPTPSAAPSTPVTTPAPNAGMADAGAPSDAGPRRTKR
jgi:hypothetical protein